MRKALLGISCCVGFMAIFVFAPIPAKADGPYKLSERGNDRSFPTWQVGKSTKLCVENLDGGKSASVTVNAGDAQEQVTVFPRATKCIDRHWAGIRINVVNSRGPSVKVWTE